MSKPPFYLEPKTWHSVGVNWEETQQRYRTIFQSGDELPERILKTINWERDKDIEYDIATPFLKGKAWLFEGMAKYQPKTYSVLMESSSDLMIGDFFLDLGREDFNVQSDNLFIMVINRYIALKASFHKQYSENFPDEVKNSPLPEPLLRAYYWRIEGWSLPATSIPPSGMDTRQLPTSGIRGSEPLGNVLESFCSGDEKEALSAIIEHFPDIAPNSDNVVTNFRSFLDTRPEDICGKLGDQLFLHRVKEGEPDRNIYLIHNGDWRNIRILPDPVSALDDYMSFIFLKKHAHFDFMPYSDLLGTTV